MNAQRFVTRRFLALWCGHRIFALRGNLFIAASSWQT